MNASRCLHKQGGAVCTAPARHVGPHSDQYGNEWEAPSLAPAPETTKGRKFDSGKADWSLMPFRALRQVVEVLTIGAKKYDRHNWVHVPNAKARYFAAAQRHVTAWWADGEQNDPETGLSHLAHAICCLTFLLAFDLGDTVDPAANTNAHTEDKCADSDAEKATSRK